MKSNMIYFIIISFLSLAFSLAPHSITMQDEKGKIIGGLHETSTIFCEDENSCIQTFEDGSTEKLEYKNGFVYPKIHKNLYITIQ